MQSIHRIAICTLILTLPMSLVSAGPFEDGVAAYRNEQFVSAMNLWLPLAEAGDARAQANIGVLYRDAQGVPHGREVLAYMWFSLAASGGNKQAERERDDLARRMTAAQVADAKKRASEWKPK